MYIAQQDSIVYPRVTIEGKPVVSARIINQVNEISTATVYLKPEDITSFSPDQEATIQISDAPNSGPIFKGHVSSVNFSNMNGQLTAGIDLKHRAKWLDEASGLIPGLTPGGNYDVETIIYKRKSTYIDGASGAYFKFDVKKPFPEAICGDSNSGLIGWISNVSASSCNGFVDADAGEKGRTISMLNQIKNDSEPFRFKFPELSVKVSQYCNNVLNRATTSSTMWDMLMVILGSFDCCLVCKPDGKVIMTPNWAGVKSSVNSVDSSFITKFDLSSLTPRNIKHCRVVGAVGSKFKEANKMKNQVMGNFSEEGVSSGGSMFMSAPGWINDIHVDAISSSTQKSALDALAQCILYREKDKDQTVNLITPISRNVIPGTCATFIPASSIISFHTGSEVSPFRDKYDGYCYRVEHIMASDTWSTIFYFQTCTSNNRKVSSHPFFPSATQPIWEQ
jgi:hypothetical protein